MPDVFDISRGFSKHNVNHVEVRNTGIVIGAFKSIVCVNNTYTGKGSIQPESVIHNDVAEFESPAETVITNGINGVFKKFNHKAPQKNG